MPQSDTVNRRIVLAARPRGLPTAGDFRLDQASVPSTTTWSTDWRMRRRRSSACSKDATFGKLLVRVANA